MKRAALDGVLGPVESAVRCEAYVGVSMHSIGTGSGAGPPPNGTERDRRYRHDRHARNRTPHGIGHRRWYVNHAGTVSDGRLADITPANWHRAISKVVRQVAELSSQAHTSHWDPVARDRDLGVE